MEKQLFAEQPAHKREEMLDANADAVEEMDYIEYLDEDQMKTRKDQLSVKAIEESKLNDILKKYKAEVKEKLKPIILEKNQLLEEIKHGSINVNGKCYKIIEGDRVGYYNPKGMLILERPANDDERQGTIMQLQRSAVNQ